MKVKYKGIVEERFQDAPFIGALVIANDCHHNCPGCFNQYLRRQKSNEATAEEIIDKVKENQLHQGIILGGLEWSEQPEEMFELIQQAKNQGLQTIIYTHHERETFEQKFPWLQHSGIYVKYGEFQQGNVKDVVYNGVRLASGNQYIVYYE